MIRVELQKYISTDQISVMDALGKINDNAKGIIFIVDDAECLYGSISDGDIRRFLIAGGELAALIEPIVHRPPRFAHDLNEARRLYDIKGFTAIPIVDREGRIEDIYFGGESVRQYPRLSVPVVINAGGKGTRLDPYTKVLPKPLIPVGEYPIIEHIMREFEQYACDRFHVIVNYKREILKAYFTESEDRHRIAWYDETTPLGTGGRMEA